MKNLLIIILIACLNYAQAQNRNTNWIFCDSVGYNFITQDTFHTKFSTVMPYWGIECLSTISTESGELLFSCDGTAVYQGTSFDTVLNGGGLFGNKSYTNGCVIFPLINFYILINRRVGGCDYNIIRFDSSFGKWTVFNEEKNIKFIKKSITEQVCAIKHGNGRDWWVIAHSNTHIYVSLFDVSGYISTDSIAHDFGCLWSIGEISVSAQGNKVAVVDYLGKLSLFDFNRCSGEVSKISDYNVGFTNCNTQVKTYGCCFSPNGRYLYVSNMQDTLFQFDVTAPDILASKKVVYVNVDNTKVMWQMERTPNNKIALSHVSTTGPNIITTKELSLIDKPDEQVPNCNFMYYGINLYHKISSGLPNMPDFYLGPLAGSPCDTLSTSTENKPEKSIIRVYPNPAKEVLNIEILNNLKLNNFTLLTLSGTELMSLTPTRSLTQLNLRNILPGVYLLRIVHADGTVQVRKVVKQ